MKTVIYLQSGQQKYTYARLNGTDPLSLSPERLSLRSNLPNQLLPVPPALLYCLPLLDERLHFLLPLAWRQRGFEGDEVARTPKHASQFSTRVFVRV